MNEAQTRNAKIEGTMLGYEEHGILSFWIYLDYGGSGQGFGGYALDGWNEARERRVATEFGMEAIARILRVVGVEKWEDLPGKSIRAMSRHDKVERIGNYLKDDWLDMEALAREYWPDDQKAVR